MNKLIQVGILNGKHEQSNRIYSEDGLSPTIMAGSRRTCTGGFITPKILIKNKRRDKDMWKNDLGKFDFKMDEVRLFDAFAGKGALHKSLKKLGVPTKVVGLSEIEPDAIIAYAGVHINNFKNLEFDFPTDEEMKELLIDRNIGWDFIKQKSSIPRMKKEKLKLLYKATILTNNLGDISKLDYNNMFDFDLFNLSFCCQDISNAGKQKGLKNEDGTHTRSGLIKFGLDVIKAKKPKYIMIENVKALIQKKFINDFYSIVNEIESYGYKCHYATKEDKKGNISPTCLNAKDFGIPQNRERIFVICVRNDINIEFEFPKGFDKGIRLKDLLEDNVDEKYYLSEEIQNRFKLNGKEDLNHNELNVVGSSAPECRTIGQRDMTYGVNGIMSTLTATNYKQPKQIVDNTNKVERLGGIFDKNGKIHQAGSVYNRDCLSPTITTCEGGYRMPIVREKEEWLEYKDSGYYISNTGMVKCKDGSIKSQRFDKDGYLRVNMTIDKKTNSYRVHTLVATLFVPNADLEKNTVNHKDGNKTNNYYKNLEWCTIQENLKHRAYILKTGGSKPNQLKGVHFNKSKNKWEAQIKINNKSKYIGRYENQEEAYNAYYNKFVEIKGYAPWKNEYRQPIVEDNEIKVIGKLECEGWHDIETRVHSLRGICPTMETRNRSKWLDEENLKIRKLTPLECWRLMGFDDEDFYNTKELGLSDSSLYKLAGNSIVVNCLYYIFKEVFKEYIINKEENNTYIKTA